MRIVLAFLIFLSKVSYLNAQTYSYDFASGHEGWSGNFADYPVGSESFYELEFQHSSLPQNINSSQKSLKISGNNHSDDLFMYVYKEISGLEPNTSYNLIFNIEFASSAPTNAPGVGGAPGEGVTMKAGAILYEPQRIINYDSYPGGFYLINLDKGNQSSGGADMDTVGHVGVSDTTTMFTLKTNDNKSYPFRIKTGSVGSVWIIIGTDSGFEATTTLFYNKITISFGLASAVPDPFSQNRNKPFTFDLTQNYPNPFNPETIIHYQLPITNDVELLVYNLLGERVKTIVSGKQQAGSYAVKWSGRNELGRQVSSGVYFYQLEAGDFIKKRKMLLLQ